MTIRSLWVSLWLAAATLLPLGIAQADEEGTFVMRLRDDGDIQLSLRIETDRGGNHHSSSSYSAKRFGKIDLSKDGKRDINFVLLTDAGNIVAEGTQRDQQATGVFAFTPNDSYMAKLNKMGFSAAGSPTIGFALLDVSLDFAKEVSKLKVRNMDADQLLAFKAVGGTTKFIKSLRKVGYKMDDADDLIAFTVHDISADYIKGIKRSGLEVDEEQIIAMRIHGIEAAYVKLVSKQFKDAYIDDIIAAKIHGLSPDYIKGMKKLFKDADFEELLAAKIHGVSAHYVKNMRDKDISIDSLEKAISLKIHDIY